jgi:two-component system cell cycle sensor histidine kinase/response regulator CckA
MPGTVRFRLLLATTTEAHAVTLPPRETLLVVDDEEIVRRLAARILFEEGYHVFEASSGEEAVRLLQRSSNRIHGVLTDIAMPGLSGRQLGETILRCWPGVRVVYMSGFPAGRIVGEGELDPSVPFIPKPFTREQLAGKVRLVLTRPVGQ